jgi:hypothetical protein
MAPTPVSTTISASRDVAASSTVVASAGASSSASTSTAHAWYVGALRGDFNVSAFQDAVVENESLRDETGFGKLNVRVPGIIW